MLDSRSGWEVGGDSGPAIVPGKSAESRFVQAIRYETPDLQMPPEGKLPDAVIRDFVAWIDAGAVDPREDTSALEQQRVAKKQFGLPVERAEEHWAYRDLQPIQPPASRGSLQTSEANVVDAFINQKLSQNGLNAAESAPSAVLVRRLYFDLLGLPPTPQEFRDAVELLSDEQGYARLVDRLLSTTRYGENFARKWMDVVRYADSITLRGFILPEAWRYRDYLVEAYASDRPFDQMIREQIAGDLLEHEDLQERQKQLIATGFLALGNTNLEQQDKTQLEMDFIDEQLEVLGRAFLGQTIGCARCHDHKFDPIPTSDYYALAGILRSAVALKHDNVSKWVDLPLPLPKRESEKYAAWESELTKTKALLAKLNRLAKRPSTSHKTIAVESLPGIVLDDQKAKLVGVWNESTSIGPFVGHGYLHDGQSEKGSKTATFEPDMLEPGEYEVRLAYTAGANRATNTQVHIFSADGEATRTVNQTSIPEDAPWISLGKYRFEKDGQAFVLVSNVDANGHVVVDAVQFLSLSNGSRLEQESARVVEGAQGQPESSFDTQDKIAELESASKELEARLNSRPKFLTLVQELPPADIPIHIRGDVHNLGKVVPRGFLTAINRGEVQNIPPTSSGRLEMANWLSSRNNALTARVYANRVWSWLMGQGLVPSVNNFGTTGMPPTHPELLEWLAKELIESKWSTKHLVQLIVSSDAYRRQIVAADKVQSQVDPANTFYWRGHTRRLSAEALRDAMLLISGELDESVGGSLIKPGAKADYNYTHSTTRRSIYHPVFRNSLPELFEAFDFADSSVSIGQRPRSTVATQSLALMNDPWVAARAAAATQRFMLEAAEDGPEQQVQQLYLSCHQRPPTLTELSTCTEFLGSGKINPQRLQTLVHSLFASIDFRYLD